MRSSNPVLTRLTPETQTQRGRVDYPIDQSGYGQPVGGYGTVTAPDTTDRVTIDDVVVRTVGLLAILGLVGALTWTLIASDVISSNMLGPVWIISAIAGLGLGLVIAFARITNPLVIGLYAAVQGVFVGAISMAYESVFEGIVLQAAVGTFGLFFIMAALYKARIIRATPKFVKFVMAALIGVVAIIVVNFLLTAFTDMTLGVRDGGPLAIVFSLVVIAIASLTFVLDFAQIEEGVRQGAPRKYAWYYSFGILVGLIWLYLEILRLLSYLRDE